MDVSVRSSADLIREGYQEAQKPTPPKPPLYGPGEMFVRADSDDPWLIRPSDIPFNDPHIALTQKLQMHQNEIIEDLVFDE